MEFTGFSAPLYLEDMAGLRHRRLPLAGLSDRSDPALANHGRDSNSSVHFWIADGQHRAAALCLAFGRIPAWLRGLDAQQLLSCLVLLDASESPPHFRATPIGAARSRLSVPILDILSAGSNPEKAPNRFIELAARLRADGSPCAPETLRYALERVSLIRSRPVSAVLLEHTSQEEILKIFHRQVGGGLRFRRKLLRLLGTRLGRSSRKRRAATEGVLSPAIPGES
jgi:hypothetical protein